MDKLRDHSVHVIVLRNNQMNRKTDHQQLVCIAKSLISEEFSITDFILITDSYQRATSLTSGAPIYGNIIAKVRRERRQTAWTSSRSSSSSVNSVDCVGRTASKNFPLVLPQETVALELGIITTTPPNAEKSNVSDLGVYDSNEVDKLLSAARKWRIRSQANRTLTQNET